MALNYDSDDDQVVVRYLDHGETFHEGSQDLSSKIHNIQRKDSLNQSTSLVNLKRPKFISRKSFDDVNLNKILSYQ